ncbi:MAG: serine hydrolase domain-containing protein [Luteolibacter sp.]|jgi:CubicO group peptidase (beta-lactamase class C family)|nr:serine hydrolase domain-containing protein [Luteolibacter sp.]
MTVSVSILAGSAAAALPSIDAVTGRMEAFVKSGEIVGAVTFVGDPENTLHLSSAGMADLETRKPMREDTVFWIASMTKPITGTAVMMMQEEGKLSVDDPVSKYLPEFRNLKDAAGKDINITIQQCLTHSSGLDEVSQEQSETITTLAQLMPLIVSKPVKFPPGSKWEYCQTGINTAARIVEVVSGKMFPVFLQERLFEPLGMKDTSFYPTENMLDRMASSYRRAGDGTWEKVGISFLGGKALSDGSRYPRASGGLFSTAPDYARFCRMILREGELDGRRYLKSESVKQMTTVQSGDLKTGFTPGNGWGLGCCVVREPQGVSATLSPGSFGHGGAFGTQVWIDPVKKRFHILMVQRADFPNSDASDVRGGFHEAAAAHP